MNIFHSNPDLLNIDTLVTAVREMPGDRIAITTAENIVRPAGGGQPRDTADVLAGGLPFPVENLFKADGQTWLLLDAPATGPIATGRPVTLNVDPLHRERLSRCHSLTHLAMAAVKEHLPGYQSRGADIAEDAVGIELRFSASAPLTPDLITAIDRRTRSLVGQAIPISIERAKSMNDAEQIYDKWRVDPDLNLSGKIRVINIVGVDVNPCSGSHTRTTADIGPYGITGHKLDRTGINRLFLERLECWMYWL